MSISKTIKLLGWGPRAKQKIDNIRKEELDLIEKCKRVELSIANLKYAVFNNI